jgi:hypothetical protein
MDDFEDGFWDDGPDWQDWMLIGPLSEDIANEEQEIDKAYRDTFEDDCDEEL